MQTILVTGGLGYIGTAVSATLSNAGFQPVIIDNRTTSKRVSSDFPLIQGDYGKFETLELARHYRPIATLHLANSAYVGESMENPTKYFSNNVARTADLLGWCQSNGISKFVFSSSCATYGAPEVDLITEETPQVPINPYGESKLMIEKMLDWVGNLHGMRSVALRYFNVAGSSTISDARDEHDPEPHLIPRLIQAATTGSDFTVNGLDFPTTDGSPVRDFIHVDDLADAHLKSLEHLLGGGESLKLNLGTSRGTSVLDLVKSVEERFGKINLRVGERRPGDPARLVASAKLAREVLGWQPNRSSIDQILDSIVS